MIKSSNMESSYEITKFLPIKIENWDVLKYVQYHAKKLDQSIENEIESWIFFHTHILYMTFVYFQLLRISQFKEQEFKYSLIWLPSDDKSFFKDNWILKNNLNPFNFSWINEKTVFRFFRLINFDNWTIWNISKCVKERNNFAHATWIHIDNLDEKIESYIKSMEIIIEKSKNFLNEVYNEFKKLNPDLLDETDSYEIWNDDLEVNLYIPFDISEFECWKLIEWNKEDKVLKALKENFE